MRQRASELRQVGSTRALRYEGGRDDGGLREVRVGRRGACGEVVVRRASHVCDGGRIQSSTRLEKMFISDLAELKV